MSLLSAGKQISLGQDKTYGRGLFVIDPDQAERKARKQMEYQEELRAQMEEARRRKLEQKKKEEDEDKKWEEKFKQEVKRQSEKKNDKPQQINDKNFNNQNQKSQVTIRHDFNKEEIKSIRKTQEYNDYNLNSRNYRENEMEENPYLPKILNYEYMQDQNYYEESSNQKMKMMREVLQQKMNEVYNKIKQSKNLEIDREIDLIRKKINSSNNTYQAQNPKTTQLPHEFSQFYKIPKKNSYTQPQIKNLDYDSRVQYKRNQYTANRTNFQRQKDNQSQNNTYHQRFENHPLSRELESGHDERKWGLNKGKTNFLGNRQALDYQIDNILNSIDNNLQQHGQN